MAVCVSVLPEQVADNGKIGVGHSALKLSMVRDYL